jgi:hypothetical protein
MKFYRETVDYSIFVGRGFSRDIQLPEVNGL